MNGTDLLLSVLVLALFPLLLGAYGNHVATESIQQMPARRAVKLKFWALCVASLLVTAGYQYHRNRIDEEQQQKLKADLLQAEAAQTRLQANEIANAKELQRFHKRLGLVLANPHSHEQRRNLIRLLEDFEATVADKLAGPIREQVRVSPPNANGTPNPSAAVPEPCHGDRLKECKDADLLAWGSRILQRMKLVVDNFQDATSGIDRHNSKWFTAFDAAQVQAAEAFRDCCAEDAINYHKELASRLGDGADADLYDWTRRLLQPVQSNEHKEAVHDSKDILFYYDLRLMQTKLEEKERKQASR